MLNKTNNRGVSLYIAVVIMAILLAVVLGVSAILLGQIKIIKGMENSVIAFYAADTGIEWILQYRADPSKRPNICTEDSPCQLQQESEAKYYVEVISLPSPQNYQIKSVGTYKETVRAIEVNY